VQCRLDLKTRQNIPLRAQLPLPLRRHILLQVMTRARKLGRKEFSTNQALIFKKKISLWDWHFFHAYTTKIVECTALKPRKLFFDDRIDLYGSIICSKRFHRISRGLMEPFSTREPVQDVCRPTSKARSLF
jgi:hypothetical protein